MVSGGLATNNAATSSRLIGPFGLGVTRCPTWMMLLSSGTDMWSGMEVASISSSPSSASSS
eukprot:4219729-Pyramimonas_sp.AAC.1